VCGRIPEGSAYTRTVAGFGFTFEFEDAGLELVRRLLRHCQRQASYFGVDMRYRRTRGGGGYLVTVDGQLRAMQALSARLWIEVPLLADWHDKPKPSWRRTDAGFAFLDGYAEGLRDLTASVQRLPKLFRRMVPPELVDRAYIPESIVFDPELVPSYLAGPLRTFEATLAMFQNLPEHSQMIWSPIEAIEVELVIEEAHTATELLLRRALGTRTAPFGEMARSALDRGWINTGQLESLIALKDLRKQIKHRGQSAPRSPDVYAMVMNAAACCHRLLEVLASTIEA
jgi:hypothetical protein